MGEGHTYSNYSVTAARPPTLKYWLQISGRTAETNIRIIRQKYTVLDIAVRKCQVTEVMSLLAQ